MFGIKRRPRRSELRLGVKMVDYETTAFQPRLVLLPAVKFWQKRGPQLSAITILVVLGGALYYLFTTPTFFVYEAEIRDNVAVSAWEIYQASKIDSQSIFWINPAEVVERITGLPNIKSASVSVFLPARVVIEVVERQPELLWQTGDTTWWVDQEGTIVPPKEGAGDMLRVIDEDRQPLEVGYKIDPRIVKGAQALRMLAPTLSVIVYSRSQGLTVATPEGWPVYLGDGSQIKAKLVVLTTVLADLKERNITPAFIDMRNPLRPVYRPASVIVIPEPMPRPSAGQQGQNQNNLPVTPASASGSP
jgi:cell division protein FtsQ